MKFFNWMQSKFSGGQGHKSSNTATSATRLNKYIEAVNNGFTVGMRFEDEDSPERRLEDTRTLMSILFSLMTCLNLCCCLCITHRCCILVPVQSTSTAKYGMCTSKIWDMYSKNMGLVKKGNDGNCGSTATCDSICLQALSKRIHYGKFVAEAKFRASPDDYEAAIRAQGSGATLLNMKERGLHI